MWDIMSGNIRYYITADNLQIKVKIKNRDVAGLIAAVGLY